MKLSEIRLNPQNPRLIKDEKFKKLVESLKRDPEFMETHQIGVKNGVIMAGNMRYRALQQLGYTEIPNEWVRDISKWPDDKVRRYMVVDNLGYGEWDWDLLSEQYEKEELEEWGLDVDKWKEDDVVEDEVPEVTENPVSKLGEVYQLGRHRLMCGDSTKIEDVEKLMDGKKADMVHMDPPYNLAYTVDIDKNYRKKWGTFKNDKMTPDQWDKFVEGFLLSAYSFTKKPASAYVWIDWRQFQFIRDRMEKLFAIKACIVWAKTEGMAAWMGGDYKCAHEFCLYGKNGSGVTFNGKHTEPDVWVQKKDPTNSYVHPTQKPIELCSRAIRNSSNENDLVLDLFGGSGSTLISCEQLRRQARLMELDPKYCDVIRKRYAKFMGKDNWEEVTPCIT